MLDAVRSLQLLDRVGEGIVALDAGGRVTYLNRPAEQFLSLHFGIGAATLVGQQIWAALPQLVGSRFEAEALRVMAEGGEAELEELFPPLGRWLAVRLAGVEGGTLCHVRDVTDRRRAELAAREAQSLLRGIIEGTTDCIFIKDVHGRYLMVNAATAAVLGRPREELIGRTAFDVMPAEPARRLHQNDASVLAGGHAQVFEEWIPGNGQPRWFLSTKGIYRNSAGKVTGIIGIARDITERKAAQDALARWARIFEHAGWGVAILSADGHTIETVNPAFARMHGWRADDLAGRPTSVLQPPVRRPEAGVVGRVLHERGHHIWETEHVHRSGAVFPVLVDATVVKDDQGEPFYQAVNVQDLTERKRAEEQVRQAQKMEAVGRLAGGVAHDFNNMMMIIVGFADFLIGSMDRDDPRRSDAEEIRKAADRAQHLTRQLLSFGRQRLVARQVLSWNEIIVGLERMLRPLVGENIRLATRLAPQLGGVEADHGQLEQVVMNLALNARDAMRSGGQLTLETFDVILPTGYGYEQVGIEIPPGPYVVLQVSDTGDGMTSEVKARIFEPFFTTKPAERNTGLGLATVYGIVAQSGGYVWAESEVGRGSVFTICLPRALPDDAAAGTPATAEMPTGGSETVLLVEDEEAVRGLARRVLTKQGYTVLEAPDGRRALELVADPATAVDLVLTDVIMPELGGQELVAKLLRERPGLPVVYMSGYTDAEKLLPSLADPACSFLQKPFSPESLALKIRETLDRVGA